MVTIGITVEGSVLLRQFQFLRIVLLFAPLTVVAQLVEQRIPNPQVGGSIPSDRATYSLGVFLSAFSVARSKCLCRFRAIRDQAIKGYLRRHLSLPDSSGIC